MRSQLISLPILECIRTLSAAETVCLPPHFLNDSSLARDERVTHRIFDHLIMSH